MYAKKKSIKLVCLYTGRIFSLSSNRSNGKNKRGAS